MVVIRLVVVDGDTSAIYDLLQQTLFSGTSNVTESEIAERVRPHIKNFLEKYPEKQSAGA